MSALPEPIELLCHRPPMLLLDRVLEDAPPRLRCSATLRRDCPLLQQGRAPGAAVLEHMAQAIGAYVGLRRREHGLDPQVGYLVAARDFVLHGAEVSLGDALHITVDESISDGQSGSFHCRVERAGALFAEAQLTVYHAEPVATEAGS